MSRREDRRSDFKRYHSGFGREPSPKRSRRDGRPVTGRPRTELETDKNRFNHRRRLQDHDSKPESGLRNKESENRTDGHHGDTKQPNDPTKVPQSRSHFQHNDRGSAGHNGRSFSSRTNNECEWQRDPKEEENDRTVNKTGSSDTHRKEKMAKDSEKRNHVWHHEGYLELEANPTPVARRRPSFREQKVPTGPERTNRASAHPGMPIPQDHAVETTKRDDRGHTSYPFDKRERSFATGRDFNKALSWRHNFSSQERPIAGSRYRGRDRFNPRQGHCSTGGQVEKWKHDLYDEANRSPTPKNEEDQISKIEALLAS